MNYSSILALNHFSLNHYNIKSLKHYNTIVFVCLIFSLTACDFGNRGSRVEEQLEKNMFIAETEEETECTHEDVLKLREYKTLQSFYQSVHRWYDKNRIAPIEAFPNLNQKTLLEFFDDIDINIFRVENAFAKKYHFNKAPKEYKDSEACLDKLSISFVGKELSARVAEQSEIKVENHRCMFMLTTFNSFVGESGGCSESRSFYYFVIDSDEVVVLLIG